MGNANLVEKGGPSGPPSFVIVAGNGWTLEDDLRKARAIGQDCPVIGVNDVSKRIRLDHFFTFHPEFIEPKGWLDGLRRLSPDAPIHCHLSSSPARAEKRKALYEFVDHWHPGLFCLGTSTWGARRLAKRLGFDHVLLCGMPLMDGPYADGGIATCFGNRYHLRTYREAVADDKEFHDGVTAFSGWTGAFFGGLGVDQPWSPERGGSDDPRLHRLRHDGKGGSGR